MTEQLTRETIMVMQPGRELDAHIEVHVKGREMSDEDWATWADFHNEGYNHYSSDISAAWEVVRVLSKNYGVNVYEDDGAPCECTLVRYPETVAVVEGETAPEVICKAALLAVMDL